MPTTAQDIYNQIVQALPPKEQLHLATLILDELEQQDSQSIDHSNTWIKQDQTDVSDLSSQYDDWVKDLQHKIDIAIHTSEQTLPIDGEAFVNEIIERIHKAANQGQS